MCGVVHTFAGGSDGKPLKTLDSFSQALMDRRGLSGPVLWMIGKAVQLIPVSRYVASMVMTMLMGPEQ